VKSHDNWRAAPSKSCSAKEMEKVREMIVEEKEFANLNGCG
jgi:hypothetical protein